MKATSIKCVISFAMALLQCLTAIPFVAPDASAATSQSAASEISARLPIVTYAMPLSGASRVCSYSGSSLSQMTAGYYIDAFVDQVVITRITSDGKAVRVKYPSASSSSGYRSRWFAADDSWVWLLSASTAARRPPSPLPAASPALPTDRGRAGSHRLRTNKKS